MSRVLDCEKTKDLLTEVFRRSGLKTEEAAIVAENLVTAEMRGVRSHGILQTANYSKWMRQGIINCNAEIKDLQGGPCTLAIDADYAPGAVAGRYAMQRTIQKAKMNGVSMTTVKNGTHFGMAAFYAMEALKEGLIGLAFTSAGRLVAPFGGYGRELGTNPICIAVPAFKERPLVFDGATSTAAFNKLFYARTEGKKIPLDWAVDSAGEPTDDPAEAIDEGALVAFGGYKGYGLSIMVSVMTGLLSGTNIGNNENNNFLKGMRGEGFNFMAVDIGRFVAPEEFKKSVDALIGRLKSAGKKKGVKEIYVPGELEFLQYEKCVKEGIAIDDGVAHDVGETLRELKIEQTLNDCSI